MSFLWNAMAVKVEDDDLCYKENVVLGWMWGHDSIQYFCWKLPTIRWSLIINRVVHINCAITALYLEISELCHIICRSAKEINEWKNQFLNILLPVSPSIWEHSNWYHIISFEAWCHQQFPSYLKSQEMVQVFVNVGISGSRHNLFVISDTVYPSSGMFCN